MTEPRHDDPTTPRSTIEPTCDARRMHPDATQNGEHQQTYTTASRVHAAQEIAASPDEVFDALTDPAALAEWFQAPNDLAATDWELDLAPGGDWRARTVAPDGTEGVLHGTFITVDAPRTLELTWHTSDDDFAPGTVRYDLEPVWRDGQLFTRVTVTHVSDVARLGAVMSAAANTAHEVLVCLTRYLITARAMAR